MSQVNGAECVAVVGEGEIPAMPDHFFVFGWDPGTRGWRWTPVEILETDAATGFGRYRPGTAEEAKALAVSRMEECGWQRVSVHRVTAPVEGTMLDGAWEKIEELAEGQWETFVPKPDGCVRLMTASAEFFYASKNEMRSQYAALLARVKARMPGVNLRYSHATLGPGRVRMRCWLWREA